MKQTNRENIIEQERRIIALERENARWRAAFERVRKIAADDYACLRSGRNTIAAINYALAAESSVEGKLS